MGTCVIVVYIKYTDIGKPRPSVMDSPSNDDHRDRVLHGMQIYTSCTCNGGVHTYITVYIACACANALTRRNRRD
jgi:hypothetical protein